MPDGSPRIPSIGAEIRDYWGHNISLSASSGHFPYSTDFLNGHSSPPSPDLYDHVIFCRGQDPKEIGQPSQIASLLGRPIAILASTDHRVVGVQYCNHASCGARERDTKGVQIVACDTKSCSAKIRVLGVAGNLLATMVFDRHTAQMKAAEDFQLSLPAQARFPGHTLCCTDAAEANRFFDAAPNTNVNTMSLSELESVLMDLHLAQDVDRARRIRPFGLRHSYELEHELRSRPSKQLPVNWRALISKLTYGY